MGFLLRPGDTLYIPRGYLHNASTTINSNTKEHSIHLSIGIEHACDTTWEALMHHALVYYSLIDPSILQSAVDPTFCHGHGTISWMLFMHYSISAFARLDVLLHDHKEVVLLR